VKPGRRGRSRAALGDVAHELRSSLNGIHTWAHVLEGHLGAGADGPTRRALDGIREAIDAHLRVIENLVEGGAVEPPLRRPAMTQRNDAQPEVPEDPPKRERPKRPATEPKEQPGGSEAGKAEQDARNKSTRTGER
jgi:hypothetical protein